jgi:hypothetical protein
VERHEREWDGQDAKHGCSLKTALPG